MGLAWLARIQSDLAPAVTPSGTPQQGNLAAIGGALFGPFTLPFEIASLVLLAAIVGAVVLGRRKAA